MDEAGKVPEKTEPPARKPESVLRQIGNSTLGEVTAFGVAIGAVYASERMMPQQTASFISHLAEKLGQWRGASAESQAELAKKIVDVGIMNIAGASSMAVQFGVRRSQQKPEEKTPFWYEAGRLAMGRIFGTITAIGSLTLMSSKAPGMVRNMENMVSGGGNARSGRFAELLVSNSIQTVGAIAGNAPAQLLYDHLINLPAKAHAHNAPERA